MKYSADLIFTLGIADVSAFSINPTKYLLHFNVKMYRVREREDSVSSFDAPTSF